MPVPMPVSVVARATVPVAAVAAVATRPLSRCRTQPTTVLSRLVRHVMWFVCLVWSGGGGSGRGGGGGSLVHAHLAFVFVAAAEGAGHHGVVFTLLQVRACCLPPLAMLHWTMNAKYHRTTTLPHRRTTTVTGSPAAQSTGGAMVRWYFALANLTLLPRP